MVNMNDPRQRAVYLLDIVARFINENTGLGDRRIWYDEALCDGFCLRDDCMAAAADLRRYLEEEQRLTAAFQATFGGNHDKKE